MSISFSEDTEHTQLTSAISLPEDRAEGSLRPKTLNEYIGQKKAKDNLRIFIGAAKLRNEPLDHVLLHGPPGLGKTTLAAVIANEMNVNMRITSGPAIEKPGDLVARFCIRQWKTLQLILFSERDLLPIRSILICLTLL